MPRDLPLGNGTVLVNFDRDYNLRDIHFPEVGMDNHSVGHPSRFGVFCEGQFAWLSAEYIRQRLYVTDALQTDVLAHIPHLQLELRFNDAVDFYLWTFVRKVSVKDLSGRDREVRLFFHHDFHIVEHDIGDTAYFDPETSSLIHYKDARYFLINACVQGHIGWSQFATGTKETAGMQGTWRDAEDGILGGNPIAQGSVDSTGAVHLNIPAHGEQVAHYWMTFGIKYEKVVKLNEIVLQKTPEKLLHRTERYWHLWVNKDPHRFADLSDGCAELFKRSLLIMRTNCDDGGAIIAANDYDIAQFGRDTYSYMWPRDGALVADAFASAGFLSVTQSFFQFCLKVITEEGYLLHKYNADGTVGSSWHPWLRQGVPTLPIQEDETALVLWALWRHFNAFRDVEAVRPLYRRLISNAAEFLVSFRDEETGLPLPSYDLWEERFGVHLFTVAAVIGGLEAAAHFATAFGEDEQAERYALCAEETRQAMIEHMWSPPHQRFARMATRTKSGYTLDVTIDAANYGVFAFGALPADDPKVIATMNAIEERLSVKTQVGGVARYENDYYQQVSQDIENVAGNPWFICTLWVAQHKIAVAKSPDDLTRAREILEWVVGHALPSGVLAEQVHPYTGEPLSVSPLTWSHATFVTCVLEYVQARERLSGKHPTKQSPASVSIGVPNNA